MMMTWCELLSNCRPGCNPCLTLIKPALTVGKSVELIKTCRNTCWPTPLRDPTPVEYVIRALKIPVTDWNMKGKSMAMTIEMWNKVLTVLAKSLFQVYESDMSCSVCGKFFSRKGDLAVHQKVHTGERPYDCRKGCQMSFKTSSNRARHERSCNNVLLWSFEIQITSITTSL